ncbi:MAG: hydrogenase assembly protein HypC [Desulfurococcales archaeon ex4484_204]|nr:MAG: hydrogenase assembly protein HypC [Desulfurococcales archaeon ex4484_204]
MCLGVPARVIDTYREGSLRYARVDLGGVVRDVIVATSEDLSQGDYVIVHAGIAISKIREEEVEETLKVWEELVNSIIDRTGF